MRPLALALLLLAAPTWGAAPADHCANPGGAWVPREVLEKPIGLRAGIGAAHEAVSTASPEAQAYCDQGLAFLHSFAWNDAARSYHEALRRDPNLAMAHLGLSRAYTGLQDDAAALAELARAQALAGKATPGERVRIALRERQLAADAAPGDTDKLEAYRDALDDALAAEPSDPELWLLRGHLEGPRGPGGGQGNVAFIAFYEAALTRGHDYFAAHHHLVHGYEAAGLPGPALEHAARYAALAPAVPHAHHMHGHGLRRAGRVAEAVEAFQRADALLRAQCAQDGLRPEHDWHFAHNLTLWGLALQQLGRLAEAERVYRELAALPDLDELVSGQKAVWAEFLLARGRAAEALEAAGALAGARWPSLQVTGQALRGRALARLGREGEARAALAQGERALAQLSGRFAPAQPGVTAPPSDALPKVGPATVEVGLELLRGELGLRSGPRPEPLRALRAVLASARGELSPDGWSRATFQLEAVAAAARGAGEWALAAEATAALLAHDPSYGGAQLAAGLLARHQGDPAGASRAFAQARERWATADPGLPELRALPGAAPASR